MTMRILAVTHSNFSHLYHKVLKIIKLPLTIDILEIDFGELEKMDYGMLENYDLMITSGAHLTMIEEAHADLAQIIPIYPIQFSEADIVKGLVNASQYGDRIMLMYFPRLEFKVEKYSKLLGIEIAILNFKNLQEAEKLIDQYSQNGFDALVGTSSVCEIAQKKGIPNIFIYSTDSLRMEIVKAYQFANLVQKTKELSTINEALYEHVTNPIIILNSKSEITFLNIAALKFLGITHKQTLIRENIKDIMDITISPNLNDIQIIKKTNFNIIIETIQSNKARKSYILIVDKQSANKPSPTKNTFVSKYQFDNIVHQSQAMKKVILKAKQYALSDASLLIRGNSGTGKELIAHSIHKHSARRLKPFITVNCSAIPHNILESELFGYEEGTFTGAKKGGKPGLFELAQDGTIFLDEIGEIPMELQAKLLRVLQEKEVVRLGGYRVISLNVRIISATNKDLKQLVADNQFREDLFYRLNVLQLQIPSLAERKEDLPIIFYHLLIKHGLQEPKADHLISQVKERLLDYNWPGNIRELENMAQRLCALNLVHQDAIYLEKAFYDVLSEFSPDTPKQHIPQISFEKVDYRLGTMEKKEIIDALIKYNGRKKEAAEMLGISRTTLWRKIKQYQIE